MSHERLADVLRTLLALAGDDQQHLVPGRVHHLRHAIQLCGAEVAAAETVTLRRPVLSPWGRQPTIADLVQRASVRTSSGSSLSTGKWHRWLLCETMR